MNTISIKKMIAFQLNLLLQTLACKPWEYNLNTLLEYVSLFCSLLYRSNRYVMLPGIVCGEMCVF